MSMTFVSGRQRTEPTQQTVQSVRNHVTFNILNSKLINSELEAHIAHSMTNKMTRSVQSYDKSKEFVHCLEYYCFYRWLVYLNKFFNLSATR